MMHGPINLRLLYVIEIVKNSLHSCGSVYEALSQTLLPFPTICINQPILGVVEILERFHFL